MMHGQKTIKLYKYVCSVIVYGCVMVLYFEQTPLEVHNE
jgi:hypothetical protein